MGAFNFGFFLLGYYVCTKREPKDGIELNKANAEFIDEMMKWRNYGGTK
ncbi:MAG: hypothetical protein IKG65_08080 [Exiguobacterium sp.]|nr:hypothetical protein [Exiguobacterium sp.]MBR3216855.1 hypothetical protein [Exiguobacterium sp.]